VLSKHFFLVLHLSTILWAHLSLKAKLSSQLLTEYEEKLCVSLHSDIQTNL
jgi:hypothetical protein